MAKTSSSFFTAWPDNLPVIICNGLPHVINVTSGMQSTDGTQQIERFGLMIFKRGLQPSVGLQLKAYRNSTLIGSSDLFRVADIEAAYRETDNFLGWVRFTFSPRLNLSASALTTVELELSNYSYDQDNTWIGACLDWPTTMGYNTTPTTVTAAPAALELYGQVPIR